MGIKVLNWDLKGRKKCAWLVKKDKILEAEETALERLCSRNFKLSNISVEYGYVGKVGESSGSRQRSRQGHNQEMLLYFKELEFLLCEVWGTTE